MKINCNYIQAWEKRFCLAHQLKLAICLSKCAVEEVLVTLSQKTFDKTDIDFYIYQPNAVGKTNLRAFCNLKSS
ncbi:MAG: hypothetical protein RL516_1766 [Bacteroidota bacterium]